MEMLFGKYGARIRFDLEVGRHGACDGDGRRGGRRVVGSVGGGPDDDRSAASEGGLRWGNGYRPVGGIDSTRDECGYHRSACRGKALVRSDRDYGVRCIEADPDDQTNG